jgi:outer membrane protein assembly factor BamB
MPADLQDLFAALGAYSDSVAPGSSDAARQRGRRRRRNRLTAVAVVLVLVVGITVAAAAGLGRPTIPPSHPAPVPTMSFPLPTVSFTALTPVGPGVPMALPGDPTALAAVVGDRAYVGGHLGGGHLQVSAIDLRTGQRQWSTVDPGGFTDWAGLRPTDHAVSVGTMADTLLMLDPATGHLLWQRAHGTLSLSYPDVSIQQSEVDGAVEGLDSRTGQPLWRVSYPVGPHWDVSQNVSSGRLVPAGTSGPDPADHRLMAVGTDGTLRVYDVTNGHLLQTVAGVGTTGYHQAIDNVLYAIGGGVVDRFDLATGRRQAPFYTTPAGHQLRSAQACGAALVCVVMSGSGPSQLVAVDAATGATRWSAPAGQASWATAVGDRIITNNGWLFDLAGHHLYDPSSDVVSAGWLTAGSVLEIIEDSDGTRVVGVSTVDGKARQLGRIPVLAGSCGWNTTTLVCPTADGFHVYRFAG